MRNNILENLELKLLNTKLENAEKLNNIETEYKKEYSDFFDTFIQNDNSGFRRIVSVDFQLNKLDNPNKNNNDIFKESVNKALKVLFISEENKTLLESKLFHLLGNKDKISDLYIKNSNLQKDFNFPILESLEQFGLLTNEDLLNISLKYKENPNFLESIKVLDLNKLNLIKSHFYELNDSKNQSRISSFENDFKEEIETSENIKIYPKVTCFIGKNYFRLKLKRKIESKKDALRRLFKITFLKLYRLKYSGIDISTILKKIDSLDDLDSMVNLLLKFFEQLKQNPNLSNDYVVSDETDEVSEIFIEAEENKEKVLFLEKNTINASSILESCDKHISLKNLDNLLGEDVDLVGDQFINRENSKLNEGIKAQSQKYYELEENEEEDDDESEEIDLILYFEKLKLEFNELENKKIKLFLDGNYDELDILNNEILKLIVKLEKISKLIGIEL